MLSRRPFLRWRSPSAAKEVVDPPALRINIDAPRVKITIVPHFGVSVCGRGGAGLFITIMAVNVALRDSDISSFAHDYLTPLHVRAH